MKKSIWNPLNAMPEQREFEVYHVINEDPLGMAMFHEHPFYEFFIYISGSIHICVEDKMYTPTPYSLFVYPPGVTHGWLPNGETGRYERAYFYVSKDFIKAISIPEFPMDRILEEDIKRKHYGFQLGYDKGSSLVAQIDEILSNHKLNDPAERMLNKCRFCMLLISVCRLFTANQDDAQTLPLRLRDILLYINEHISEDITLNTLAEQFYISKYYLLHSFKEYTDMSVHQYIIHKRITYAQSLMRRGIQVGAAAQKSGFNDYAGFYRTFRKFVGMTPLEYFRQSAHSVPISEDSDEPPNDNGM